MVDFITDNTNQAVPAKGQQVVLLASYSGTAATTGTPSAKVMASTKFVTITLSNVTSVGNATITLQGSNDPVAATTPASANWTTLTAITSTVTTQTSYSTIYTDSIPWSYYRVNTGANASTNTMAVTLNF